MFLIMACSGGDVLPDKEDQRDPKVMIAQCEESECKSKWGLLAWRNGVQSGRDVMPLLTSLEQQVIMQDILSEQPTWLPREFCDSLSDTSVTESCLRLMSRPHLWAVTKKSLTLLTPQPLDVQFEQRREDCGTVGCWYEQALLQVEKNQFPFAGELCASEPVQTLREECFFGIAEKTTLEFDDSQVFCYLAGTYRSNCYEHLIETFVKKEFQGENDWGRIRAIDQQLVQFWKERDAKFGYILRSRLWGETIRVYVARTPTIGSAILRQVPEEHHIQVIAAFAQLVARKYTKSSLQGYVEQLDLVLNGLENLAVQGQLSNRNYRQKLREGVEYQYVFGKSIRPVFSDENEKIAAVVEALYLEKKLDRELLNELVTNQELSFLCNELAPVEKR